MKDKSKNPKFPFKLLDKCIANEFGSHNSKPLLQNHSRCMVKRNDSISLEIILYSCQCNMGAFYGTHAEKHSEPTIFLASSVLSF